MGKLGYFKFTIIYIASIVGVNILFDALPLLDTPWGDKWPPGSIVVGLIFVLRDFAQREVGHRVLLAMLGGAAISYWMASPIIAAASLVAFIISELGDWAFYSYTQRSFRDRVIISSMISTPLDSVVFLMMIGHFTWTGMLLMTASKMVAAMVIWNSLAYDAAWESRR